MDFSSFIVYLFNIGVAGAAVLAFVMIMFAGMRLLVSKGDPSAMSDAKKKIKNALLGLLVALLSYVLLTTINPNLVVIKGTSSSASSSGGTVTGSNPSTVQTFTFQEIPIGTITEDILTGNSSMSNGLPCYGYETQTYDSNGNIIIGNTVDRNKDGKIDNKDVYLDKDAFYCMKTLSDAVRAKVEVQLRPLIEQLSSLMKSGCSCRNVYSSSIPPKPYAQIKTPTGGKCNCPSCESYCTLCGDRNGCSQLPNNPISNALLGQYKYDACSNRKQIDCKRQEIKQLIDGTKPDDICYTQGFINQSAPKDERVLSLSTAISRLSAYQSYFSYQTSALKDAEWKMKDTYGERLSLAEVNELEATAEYFKVQKQTYGIYDTSRYCKQYNCKLSDTKKSLGVNNLCSSGSLNIDGNACIESSYYLYDGDGATFYYSADYNDYKKKKASVSVSGDKCSVAEGDISQKSYTGIIPIGEVVDETEKYGEELASRIGDVITTVQGISSNASSIYALPDSCSSSNCRQETNCCSMPPCGCDGDCCCSSVWYVSCYPAVPSAYLYKNYQSFQKGDPVKQAYAGCSGSCYGGMPEEPKPAAQYWTCPFGEFCKEVKAIYQTRTIDDSCYEPTADKAEATKRSNNLAEVGYLQQFKYRLDRLFVLSNLNNLPVGFQDVSTDDVIGSVCENYLINPHLEDLSCNGDLTIEPIIKNRFTLLSLLTLSRERMTGCVQGYGYPYKNDLAETRLFSCEEGIDLTKAATNKLTIIYDQNNPYPQNPGAKTYNCYPLSSSYLTEDQQEECFTNKDKYDSTNSDPGCQNFIQNYMDNYYCCE